MARQETLISTKPLDSSQLVESHIRMLREGEPDQAAKASNALQAMGSSAVVPLLESLGNRKWFTIFMDPIFRWFDSPGRLKFKPAEKLFNERVEEILASLGPSAMPELAKGLDHPDFLVREAAARLLARQDRAAIPVLLEGLRNPRSKFVAGDALVSIGKPALDPLLSMLRSEVCGSSTWNAADAAFSKIIGSPTRKEVLSKRNHLLGAWIGALSIAALSIAIGLWAEIGLWPSVSFGLMVGYAIWVAVLHESNGASNDDNSSIIFFLIECVTAPFIYHEKVREYRSRKAVREKLVRKHDLPA